MKLHPRRSKGPPGRPVCLLLSSCLLLISHHAACLHALFWLIWTLVLLYLTFPCVSGLQTPGGGQGAQPSVLPSDIREPSLRLFSPRFSARFGCFPRGWELFDLSPPGFHQVQLWLASTKVSPCFCSRFDMKVNKKPRAVSGLFTLNGILNHSWVIKAVLQTSLR